MASLSQHKQKVHRFLDQVNKQKSDHVTKQQLVQWFMKITEDEDILKEEDFRQLKIQMEDSLDQWIDLYLREVCEIEPQNVKNIEFKQDECFDFLEWVLTTKITQKNQENQDEDEQNEQKEQNQQNQNPSNVSNKLSNKSKIQNKAEESGQKQQNVTKNRSNISQTNKSPQQEGKKSHLKQNAQRLAKSKLNHLQQQANEFVQNLFGSKQKQQSIKKSQLSEPQQDIKLTQNKDRYKEYIETIFEHYCKINFGLAKDNTFESMQKNVNIITINKFMIFCNDFEINVLVAASLPKDSKDKTSKTAIRNQLMEVFKKNSLFHKQMTIQLFIQALQKIGQVAFARLKEQQKKSQKNISGEQQKSQKPSQQSKAFKLSYELTKMIKYMEISNFKQFKQKMTKLNINYSLKFSKQLHEKKSLFNYKFKYGAEESKKHIQQAPLIPKNPNEHRNIIHKQGQQKAIKPRPNLDLGKPPMNTKNSTPNMALVSNPNGANRQKKTLSTKNLTVNQRNTPSSKMQRNIIPYKKPSHQSVERLPSNPQPNPLAGIEGYANIHLAKKGLLLVDQNNQKMSAMRKKGYYQLNNVIEEARKQTQTNPHQVYFDYMDSRRSNRAMSNISNSKPLSQYSRDPASNQSFRNGRQDEQIQLPFQSNPYGKLPPKSIHQSNIPQSNLTPLQKSRLQAYNQLQNLIDFDGSDEDQYLDQHLKKQKENNNQIGARVNKKISSLSYKN